MPRKYGNKKTEVDGFVFDSKAEANHYLELKLREHAGEIFALELQPSFLCVVNGKRICIYKADFRYKEYTPTETIRTIEKDGSVTAKEIEFTGFKSVVVDVKGFKTKEYILKKKLVEALFNITITEVA